MEAKGLSIEELREKRQSSEDDPRSEERRLSSHALPDSAHRGGEHTLPRAHNWRGNPRRRATNFRSRRRASWSVPSAEGARGPSLHSSCNVGGHSLLRGGINGHHRYGTSIRACNGEPDTKLPAEPVEPAEPGDAEGSPTEGEVHGTQQTHSREEVVRGELGLEERHRNHREDPEREHLLKELQLW